MTRFFGKLQQGATRFFNKIGQQAPKILGTISNGLSTGSNIVSKIADFGNKIASNPITMALAPEASAGISALTNLGRAGSNFLNQGAHLTDAKSYRGNATQVSNNILERAKAVRDAGENIKIH
jgi:hypothetical protein